jgi:predicted transcriptional regulator
MDDKTASLLFGVAAPAVQKIVSGPDTSANDAKMSALEKDNEDYKKQLADMQKAQSGQTGMKKGGKVRSSASKRADGCCTKGFTRA